jgi:hypothetical protein
MHCCILTAVICNPQSNPNKDTYYLLPTCSNHAGGWRKSSLSYAMVLFQLNHLLIWDENCPWCFETMWNNSRRKVPSCKNLPMERFQFVIHCGRNMKWIMAWMITIIVSLDQQLFQQPWNLLVWTMKKWATLAIPMKKQAREARITIKR